MSNTIHLLKSQNFLPLFITQFFGAFNDNSFKNAFLIWFTYEMAPRTGSDPTILITFAAGLFILPFFLFSATAGQLADKFQKSTLTQHLKKIEIVLMMICCLFFYLESINGLLVLLFFMGIQTTFFSPIKYSLLPEHLKDDELVAGNGLIEGGTFLAILLGTIFGGLVIRLEYGKLILATFLIAFAIIGWIASCFIPKAPIGDPSLKLNPNLLQQTWKIIHYARNTRSVWFAIIGISWFWLTGATFLTQFPTYTKFVIGGDEHIVTLFLTIFSVGIALGSVWCNRLIKGQISSKLIPHGLLGMTASVILFVLASNRYIRTDELTTFSMFIHSGITAWVIMFSLFMLSVCAGIYTVPLYAIMQHNSGDLYLARIIAANNILNALFMVAANILIAILYAFHFTVTEILLTIGMINIPVFLSARSLNALK